MNQFEQDIFADISHNNAVTAAEIIQLKKDIEQLKLQFLQLENAFVRLVTERRI